MKRIALLALALASAAQAQSKRYPPVPVDKDEEAAQKSKLWDAASNPQRSPYNDLVKEAEETLRDKTADSAKEAIGKLDQAVKLVPDDDKAYRLRGDAYVMLSDWDHCAADFGNGLQRMKRTEDAKATTDVRRKLGLCLARAGKLADAERTLGEAAASGSGTGEVWMRLGEVRIAMGKLDEAITALESASEMGDVSQALVRFLLAGAYDRARKPSEAMRAAQDGMKTDRELATLRTPVVPLLGVGEAEYLLGLGYSARDPVPSAEYSLLYFRRFLKLAPDSPWRRRAEDHLRELKTVELPEFVDKTSGSVLPDAKETRTAARKLMPQLRACMAKLPGVVFKVEITKVGPRSPPGPGRRTYMPPEGAPITLAENLDKASKTDLDTAVRCMEPLADKTKAAMPAIKDKDTYYRVLFYVVGP